MTREERVKICETCKHCQKDIERGILCGLTNEYADFDDKCHLYEPSEKQQEEIRANRVVARMKAMTRIGLSSYPYAFGIGVYFFIVACLGFTISEDYGPHYLSFFIINRLCFGNGNWCGLLFSSIQTKEKDIWRINEERD